MRQYLIIKPNPPDQPIPKQMEWLWLGFGVVGGWAMLSLMGNERQRRINEAEAVAAQEALVKAQQERAAEALIRQAA